MLKATYTFSFLVGGGGAVKEWDDGERGGEAINRGTAIIRGNAVPLLGYQQVVGAKWRSVAL